MPSVVVLGSTGNLGGNVVKCLAQKYGDIEIFAGVRDPSDESAKGLMVGSNVSLFPADMSKPETLKAIPRDCDICYINTPGGTGAKNRVQLVNNAIQGLRAANCKHIVICSFMCAGTSTAFGRQASEFEDNLKGWGNNWTIVRLPLFFDNLCLQKDNIRSEHKLFAPVAGDLPLNSIGIDDAARGICCILSNPGKNVNKTYDFACNPYTHNDLAKAFTRFIGQRVDFVQASYGDAKKMFMQHMPEWQTDGALELYKLVEQQHPCATSSPDDFYKVCGDRPLNCQDWVRQNISCFQ